MPDVARRQRPVTPSFVEVRQRVRRYRPTDLLPALGRVACRISDPGHDSLERWRSLSPWGLAALARESVLRGTEHRDRRLVSDADVQALHDLFNSAYDPPPPGERDVALGIILRHAYEQFLYQESEAQELARTWAILHNALAVTNTEHLTTDDVDTLVGGPLQEVLRATWLLYGSTQAGAGRWHPEWWGTAEARSLTTLTPPTRVISLAADLTADLATLRADHASLSREQTPPRHLLRWDYNPLIKHPLALLPDGQVVAPQPRLVLRRMTPGGLYYSGIHRLGDWFPSDLGKLVEQYVGLNLRLLEGSGVEGEIVYDRGSKRSVDWIWHNDDLLVLVEVKALRAALGARFGAGSFATDLASRLSTAVKQLNRTSGLIDDGHAGFKHLPAALPRVGLIVTAEPIYAGNSSQLRPYLAEAAMPTLVVSLRDLERLVAQPAEATFAALGQIASHPEMSTWLLSSALTEVLKDSGNGPSPLIRDALRDINIDPPEGD